MELVVEKLGDRVGDGPREHGAAKQKRGPQCGGGGVFVIGMAGDATAVEHDKRGGVDGAGGADDVVGEDVEGWAAS